MALIKPTTSDKPSVNFYGICDIAVLNFQDRSAQYDWADIYLDITVKQKGSDYTKSIRLAGSLDKGPDGSVSGGSVLNRLYHLFDILGVKAGINAKGGWETEDGESIDNIADYLNKGFAEGIDSKPTNFPYLAYVYKEKPKQVDGKVYTRVHHKINVNSVDGRKKLEDDMNWLRQKGYLKEAPLETESTQDKTMKELEEVFGSDSLGNM
tara:strand:+ start:611 stop:1237 length:627 start_codon:yes stop_codon:yes gene_type:complete